MRALQRVGLKPWNTAELVTTGGYFLKLKPCTARLAGRRSTTCRPAPSYSKHSLRGPLEHPLSRLQIQLCPPPTASVGRKTCRSGRLCDGGCPDNWARLDTRKTNGWIPAAMSGRVWSIRARYAVLLSLRRQSGGVRCINGSDVFALFRGVFPRKQFVSIQKVRISLI